jgi:hypothetical protein
MLKIYVFIILLLASLMCVSSQAADTPNTKSLPITLSQRPLIQAVLYLDKDMVMAEVNGGSPQAVIGIDLRLYQEHYADFFRLQDSNRDGVNELAILSSVGFGGMPKCYHVLHYNPRLQQFQDVLADAYCK